MFAMDRLEDVFLEEKSTLPISIEELRAAALDELDDDAVAFVTGSAGAGRTMDHNRRGFERRRIVPRLVRNVDKRDHTTTLLGSELPAPLLLAPIGLQSLYHPDGELATARAGASQGVPTILSSTASHTMEEVAEATGDAPAWFQLYCSTDDEITRSFLQRAEKAGYDAVVVTVDAHLMGWREATINRKYLPFLDGDGIANYIEDPAFRDRLDVPPETDLENAIRQFLDIFGHSGLDWNQLEMISEMTDLPVLVKGILHPEDATEVIERGLDGIVVSNHGGRQVDNAIGAIEALPLVVDAVEGRVPVLFDSGIRRGADAFIALALGADAVLLGRPYLYGLTLGGEDGVREVLKNFLADLDMTLALSGYTSWSSVDETALHHLDELTER
ncbi:alpha-hydroxy-acid oxidizing protein [Natrialba swarupiae]|uniref:Alpha-hydroxy-acid oxidizing protein n=2 Tax=Natrialba swarupiae TaxID=2448032 RepID=A0A5D5AHL5_9EURY|nr:alpha-hydroxy-acid oxidizing protein [Natrialba swarupiae]